MLPSFDPHHWLDSDVFIQAKNGPYGFEIAPGFWKWMEQAVKDGLIRSPVNVYSELLKGKDQLSKWATRMRSRGMFVSPDRNVQKCYGDIAVFVQANYGLPYTAKFLAGADAWVIAHAYQEQGTVVTQEVLAPSNARDVKIPNVCAHYGVNCIGAYAAFAKLGLRL